MSEYDVSQMTQTGMMYCHIVPRLWLLYKYSDTLRYSTSSRIGLLNKRNKRSTPNSSTTVVVGSAAGHVVLPRPRSIVVVSCVCLQTAPPPIAIATEGRALGRRNESQRKLFDRFFAGSFEGEKNNNSGSCARLFLSPQ